MDEVEEVFLILVEDCDQINANIKKHQNPPTVATVPASITDVDLDTVEVEIN